MTPAPRTGTEPAPPSEPAGLPALLASLRVHQWVKNLLVFVPVLTSHRWGEPALLGSAALIFAALSLCASGLYIINDLLDRASDRLHPRKRMRPIASGRLGLRSCVAASLLLLSGGLAVSAAVSYAALACVVLYAGLSGFYSLTVKRHAPLDVFFLASLYVLRILAGGIATRIHVTDWLLAFALFLFLGLAFCKRAAELQTLRENGVARAGGRGYTAQDSTLVAASGIAASFTATLVLVLYLNSDQVRIMYRSPIVLWVLAPLILFWQLRLWMLTLRGGMHDDPVLFAAGDRTTWIVGAAALGLILLAMRDLA